MGLGIGINTGLARVGNTGSRRKFKYGPLGDTVNVASRVQGASQVFQGEPGDHAGDARPAGPRVPGTTAGLRTRGQHRRRRSSSSSCLPPARPMRRRSAKPTRKPWPPSRPANFARPPASWAGSFRPRDDGPSFALLARAIASYVDEPESFDPAFRLKGK